MLIVEPRALLPKLNPTCMSALTRASSECVAARHYEVTVEHMFRALLDDPESDIVKALEYYKVDIGTVLGTVQRYIGELRSGNAGKPTFSSLLMEWIQDSWIIASTTLGDAQVRGGALLSRLLQAPSKYLPA